MAPTAPLIAIIAGETSGDQLGGWLMQALKAKNPTIQFLGIGGANMQAQGLTSLFPMQELSLMGFAEVLPHARNLTRRIRETVAMLLREQPDVLVSIDSPGFNFRVIRALKASGAAKLPKFIHYVAPTVWAYKPERAEKTAKLVDMLLTILPFEPPYFEAHGLKTPFIGHEVAWQWKQKGDGAAFRRAHSIAENAPVLAVFPGSRKGELRRLLPLYKTAVAQLRNQFPALEVILQVPPGLVELTNALTASWSPAPRIITNADNKKDLFAAATAALAKSGTIGLECVLAGLPSINVYRAHPLTAMVVRRLLKTPFVSIANMLLGRLVIAELLQEHASPEAIVNALAPLLADTPERRAQLEAIAEIPVLLGAAESQSPSDKAATLILGALN